MWGILCFKKKDALYFGPRCLNSGKLNVGFFLESGRPRKASYPFQEHQEHDCHLQLLGTRNMLWIVRVQLQSILLAVGIFYEEQMFDWTIFLYFFPFCPQGPPGISLGLGFLFLFCFVPLLLLTPLQVFIKTRFYMVFVL